MAQPKIWKKLLTFLKSKNLDFINELCTEYECCFGNELCTVRFALFNEKTEHGRLFGAVRVADKNRNGKRCFFATVR